MDLNKKQALDADPKAIQEIDFTENLDRPENAWYWYRITQYKSLNVKLSDSQFNKLNQE